MTTGTVLLPATPLPSSILPIALEASRSRRFRQADDVDYDGNSSYSYYHTPSIRGGVNRSTGRNNLFRGRGCGREGMFISLGGGDSELGKEGRRRRRRELEWS